MQKAIERAGVSCPGWNAQHHGTDKHATNTCEVGGRLAVAFRREASERDAAVGVALGQETSRCIARQWSADPDNPLGETYDYLLADTWTVWGPTDAVDAVRAEIGGTVFTGRDDAPDGVTQADYRQFADTEECVPIGAGDPADTLPPTASETLTPMPAPATGSDEPCVENCASSVASVVRDLDQILCKSQDPDSALQGDITDLDQLQTGAERILVCESGGSIDLSAYGIVYLWGSYADMAPAIGTFGACDVPLISQPPSLVLYGGNEGNPGFLVAALQSDASVTEALTDGGAMMLCDG